eukprot:747899-Hanusia_phi.AAC.1
MGGWGGTSPGVVSSKDSDLSDLEAVGFELARLCFSQLQGCISDQSSPQSRGVLDTTPTFSFTYALMAKYPHFALRAITPTIELANTPTVTFWLPDKGTVFGSTPYYNSNWEGT